MPRRLPWALLCALAACAPERSPDAVKEHRSLLTAAVFQPWVAAPLREWRAPWYEELPLRCDTHPAARWLADDWIWRLAGVAANGRALVYERWSGPPERVLLNLENGLTRVYAQPFVGFGADGARAYFRDCSGLVEVDVATGADRQIFTGPAPGHAGMFLRAGAGSLSVYFTDTQELKSLAANVIGDGEPCPPPIEYGQISPEDIALPEVQEGTVYASSRWHRFELLAGVRGARLFARQRDGDVLVHQGAGRLRARYPDGAELDLGGARVEGPNAFGRALVLGDGFVRLWNLAAGTVDVVATGVFSAVQPAEADRIFLVRRHAPDDWELAVKEPGGAERSLARGRTELRPWPSPDGTRVLVNEKFYAFEDEEGGHDPWWQKRLLDADSGRELTAFARVRDSSASFRRAGTLIHVSVWDAYERINDAATGAELYRATRSVVGDEGIYSRWSEDDAWLFTPENGYSGEPTDQYVWDAERRKESFLGHAMWPAGVQCRDGSRATFLRNVSDKGRRADVVWRDLATGEEWEAYSGQMARFDCAGDAMLLRDVVSASSPSGRLLLLDPDAREVVAMAHATRDFALAGGTVYFWGKGSLCRLELSALRARR